MNLNAVARPGPDVLLVSHDDAASLASMKEAAADVLSKSLHPLSGSLFRWSDKGWTVGRALSVFVLLKSIAAEHQVDALADPSRRLARAKLLRMREWLAHAALPPTE